MLQAGLIGGEIDGPGHASEKDFVMTDSHTMPHYIHTLDEKVWYNDV